ncbi:hypothetical protein [Nitrosophilus labii]|uniref:hypothetical protein n=1 Tax=Nitrosophilus labii TaxID=2706014 RepID=UPI0016569ACC|nr:hypothetical protein [Nitrosophilus labii]
MKKISVTVAGKTYDINIEDALADELIEAMSKDLNMDGNNSVKALLEAYLKKNFEYFLMEKKLHELLKKLDS